MRFRFLPLLLACSAAPLSTANTANPEVHVDLLFMHDGCTVYRFSDDGRHHYFTKCVNATSTTMSPQNCGKNCVRDENIATDNVDLGCK